MLAALILFVFAAVGSVQGASPLRRVHWPKTYGVEKTKLFSLVAMPLDPDPKTEHNLSAVNSYYRREWSKELIGRHVVPYWPRVSACEMTLVLEHTRPNPMIDKYTRKEDNPPQKRIQDDPPKWSNDTAEPVVFWRTEADDLIQTNYHTGRPMTLVRTLPLVTETPRYVKLRCSRDVDNRDPFHHIIRGEYGPELRVPEGTLYVCPPDEMQIAYDRFRFPHMIPPEPPVFLQWSMRGLPIDRGCVAVTLIAVKANNPLERWKAWTQACDMWEDGKCLWESD
ncbi:hypothetical protein GQ602_003073 [Ophiocordyceps camponoti-floridani]|uniref:Ubiquitin 3 binding protein But2 C-terminal domain-containing protein n=1 Tax=Ophiocordyceps camponoti-floridani TaxID=2030778 RepID=A0A8H4VDW5_9HYPO|nr:hypothetical protein GQ602_003073 [Ophiocordyceps camponoti-floridani]